MTISFKKLVLWSVFNRSFYFSGVLFDIQRKLYRHETKWSVKKPVPEPYHDVLSGCRELVMPNVCISLSRRGAPCTLLTLLLSFFTPGAHCSSSQLCRKDPILHRHIYIYLTIDFLQLPRSACVCMCWTSVQTQKPSECQQLRHYLCYLNGWHAEANLLPPLYQYLLYASVFLPHRA